MAALRGGCDRARRAHGRPGAGTAQQLRRQAVDDRPLAGPGARRDRAQSAGRRHRRDPVHRPRPLPRRARHLRQNGRAPVPAPSRGGPNFSGNRGGPLSQPMVHIPLMIRWPGMAPGRRDMLTTSVDIHATIADIFGVSAAHRTHGRSLLPAIADPGQQVREYLLAGVWGREVHYIDRSHKYVRAPAQANAPLSMWSNRWSTMPQHHVPGRRLLPPDRRARIDFMPGSQVPVLRQPFVEGDLLPLWARNLRFSGNHLWNLDADPGEQTDLAGSALEAEYAHKLHAALLAIEAPDDQAIRLGLGL